MCNTYLSRFVYYIILFRYTHLYWKFLACLFLITLCLQLSFSLLQLYLFTSHLFVDFLFTYSYNFPPFLVYLRVKYSSIFMPFVRQFSSSLIGRFSCFIRIFSRHHFSISRYFFSIFPPSFIFNSYFFSLFLLCFNTLRYFKQSICNLSSEKNRLDSMTRLKWKTVKSPAFKRCYLLLYSITL